MQLGREQRALLDGAHGTALQRQARLLVQLGEIYGAQRMVPVASVQVAGVSYKSIGDPGLEFLEDMAAQGCRVKVPTFLNPAGMDLERWEELGFPREFAEKQLRIIRAYTAMGILPTATCTPYLAGNLPRYRQTLAWSESSAVSFANSVIGARTNREGGPSALAAALLGVTPAYGLHLDENRRPTLRVKVRCPPANGADYGALGVFVGRKVQSGVPLFEDLPDASTDDLKQLGAAMAAAGAVALYHARGLTPEADLLDGDGLPTIEYGEAERTQTLQSLDCGETPDIVMIGCPHASLAEIAEVAQMVHGRHLKRPVWVCTSRVMKQAANHAGYTRSIEDAGGRLVADTCMVVAPMEHMGFRVTGVSSGKAACYLPGFCKQQVAFADSRRLVEEALK